MKHLLILSVFCLSGVSASANEVIISRYAGAQGSCQQTAQALAHQLEQGSGLKEVKGSCLRDGRNTFKIALRYQPIKGVEITSSPYWPVYTTLSQCHSALSNEKAWFESVTGLSTVISYCSLDQAESGFNKPAYGYSPRFLASGTAKSVVTTLNFPLQAGKFLGGPKSDFRQTTSAIVEQSKAEGLPAVQSYIARWNGDSELLIRFVLPADSPYIGRLKRRYKLKNYIGRMPEPSLATEDRTDPMTFESQQQCWNQLEKSQSLMAEEFTGPVTWFCMWDAHLFEAKLYHLRVNVGWESFERLTPGQDGKPLKNLYHSVTSCEADKNRVLRYYKPVFGDRLVGALCSSPKGREPYFIPGRMFLYLRN